MADEAAASAPNEIPTPVAVPTGEVSSADAVAFLRARKAPAGDAVPPREVDDNNRRVRAAVERTAAEESPSQEEDAATAETQPPGETDDEADPVGEPPISPPRSWAKAEKDAFASLPREHQQAIADRETERERYYRQGHDAAAQKAQAAEMAGRAAEQARQQYEQALPSLLAQVKGQFQANFQDIKSWDDVSAMRENDPMRFMAWQESRERGMALAREAGQVQQRQQNEAIQRWQAFTAGEDAKILDKIPELKDPKRATAVATEMRAALLEAGFSGQELAGAWDRGEALTLRDHRLQLLVRDASRYRAAEKARKAAQPKPVPPVQRPGVAAPKGEASQTYIRDLTNKAKSTGRVDDAVALLRAKRKAS